MKKKTHSTILSLCFGLLLSVVLTLSSYFVATERLIAAPFIVGGILFLAFLQFIVQSIYFLDMDKEEPPRWNLVFFIITGAIILLVILATMWIMNNLDYRMIMPEKVEEFIIHDESFTH